MRCLRPEFVRPPVQKKLIIAENCFQKYYSSKLFDFSDKNSINHFCVKSKDVPLLLSNINNFTVNSYFIALVKHVAELVMS